MAATTEAAEMAEAAETAEVAEMAEAAKEAEGAATVEAAAAKIAEGAKVMSAQSLGLGRSSPQALARLWPHAAPRSSSMKMSTGWQTAVVPNI